jgi:hypothetical protein
MKSTRQTSNSPLAAFSTTSLPSTEGATVMKLRSIAIAIALLGAGNALAQQQPFGRDSVYAVPATAEKGSPALASASIDRLGRDSAYATLTPNAPSSPVVANAGDSRSYGRGSVYAPGSPTVAPEPTAVVSAGNAVRN